MSVVLVVPQPVGVRVLNQLTNHSVQFNSHFSHFKLPCPSKKLKVSSLVINFVKKTRTKLSRKNISTEKFLCIVWSMQSTQRVKCSACFLGLFCHPWWNVWRQMMRQLEAAHQQRTSSRKYTENFPFYGLWDTIFIAFGLNLSGDAFHKFHCSVQHHSSAVDHARQLFWRMFLGNCEGRLYILHTQNQIATH